MGRGKEEPASTGYRLKVLFVFPGGEEDSVYAEHLLWRCEPLGLEYQAAGAAEDGHQLDLLDLRLHRGELRDRLSEYGPDVVGLSGYTQHAFEILRLAREIKKVSAEIKVVIGGHHATVRPADFFDPAVDAVICGEGVQALRGLLKSLESPGSEPRVPGVWRRTGNGFVSGGPPGQLVLDDLPFPERSLNLPDRAHYTIGGFKPAALIRTTEGCVFKCSFCALWRLMDGRYLLRDCGQVVRELKTIRENAVHIVDNEPWLNPKRMFDLAERISRAGINKQYVTYCRVDTLCDRADLLKTWRDIGLYSIFLGIEAITDRELTDYNKKIKLHQIEQALETAERLGIVVHSALIVRPDYSVKDFKRVARFVQRHNIRHPAFGIITPLPGTDLWDRVEEEIIERLPDGGYNWPNFDCRHPVMATKMLREKFMNTFTRMQIDLSKPLADEKK